MKIVDIPKEHQAIEATLFEYYMSDSIFKLVKEQSGTDKPSFYIKETFTNDVEFLKIFIHDEKAAKRLQTIFERIKANS